ncbi:MAG: hydrolase [Propionibacteriales bacterium]|nr:hydrolase [Propionibacteriales bacterium]
MRLSLVQLSASTDKAANLEAIDRLVALAGEQDPDLVVFPEAVMRDFGKPDEPLAPDAEPIDGPFVSELQRLARLHATTIVAGMFEQGDTELPYNTLVAVDSTGPVASYRKIHMYDSFGYRESDRLAAGYPEATVLRLADLNLGLMTCYDLRFPEMARMLVDNGADTLVVPSAWVAGEYKVDHWRTLLRARAIENTCFVAAAAQCGRRYSGNSAVIDPMGVVLASLGDEEGIASAQIASGGLFAARQRNPALAHRRLSISTREA